jgi:hypothetical protein
VILLKRYTVNGVIEGADKDAKTVSIDGKNYKVKDDELLDSLYESVGATMTVVVEVDEDDSYVISTA